jgi:hypothetical protein
MKKCFVYENKFYDFQRKRTKTNCNKNIIEVWHINNVNKIYSYTMELYVIITNINNIVKTKINNSYYFHSFIIKWKVYHHKLHAIRPQFAVKNSFIGKSKHMCESVGKLPLLV